MLAVVTRTTTLLPQAVAQRSVAEQQGKNAVESFVAMPECGCGAKAAASATAFPLAKAGRGGSKVWNPPSTTFLQSGAGSQMVSEYADAASATYSAGTNAGAASDTGATQLYQHADHLTTRLTTDNTSQDANEQRHYPYGEVLQATGTADPSVLRKYTTYLKDEEAYAGALNYAVFREHSPRIGRFNMADPVQGKIGDPQSLNRYLYSRNNVINLIDPKGLDYCSFLTKNKKTDVDDYSEFAVGGPRNNREEVTSAYDPQANQSDCEKAGGLWVTSKCSGASCQDNRNSGGGGGTSWMNPLGGTVGATEGFHGSQQTGYGAFNPYGNTGVLGTSLIGPRNDPPWGPDPSYTTYTLTWPSGVSITYANVSQYRNYERWLSNFWGTPLSHPPAPRSSVPSATLACSLTQQSGSACSYSCSSSSVIRTNMFTADIGELQRSCPGGAAITSCPLSVQGRESLGDFQITGCSQ